MTNYYTHFNDFGDIEIPPKPELMPTDVKRLFKHNSHTFNSRIYFFSESTKKFYRYFQSYGGYIYEVYSRKQTKMHRIHFISFLMKMMEPQTLQIVVI